MAAKFILELFSIKIHLHFAIISMIRHRSRHLGKMEVLQGKCGSAKDVTKKKTSLE